RRSGRRGRRGHGARYVPKAPRRDHRRVVDRARGPRRAARTGDDEGPGLGGRAAHRASDRRGAAMTLITAAALAIAIFVGAPILAHRPRRRQAEERPFPPAKLVPPTPPTARRRSLLEDRVLFGLRAASILALALLGATPFVRCSRLSLERKAGASVGLAIVIDD